MGFPFLRERLRFHRHDPKPDEGGRRDQWAERLIPDREGPMDGTMTSPTSSSTDEGLGPADAPIARRLLFVSSVVEGGSGRSQRELAGALQAEGRQVRFLVDAGEQAVPLRWLLSEFTDATVRFEGRLVGRPFDLVRRRLGSRPSKREIDGLHHESTIAPENAFEQSVRRWRPDVVVVSSISRVTWRRVRAVCRERAIPTALYLREAPAIGHLTAGLFPDLLLANSGTLVDDAARLGHRAALVPSVVRVDPMNLPPSRQVLLMVNPLASHGLHVVGPLAAARPDIPIVLQESWSLAAAERLEVDRLVRAHPNVSFRAFEPRPGIVFRDAKVLLTPHQVDNRPRTVLEAQANGLPVVASDLPGLVEAVGDGGRLVAPEAGSDEWIRAIGTVWDDESCWMRLSDRARMHAARPEVRPAVIAERFSELVDDLVGEL
jgi:glycosyltransferase involved in cell wall biosynthesis